MEDRMEGRAVAGSRGDRPTRNPFRSLALPGECTRDRDPRQAGLQWPYRSRQAEARNTEGRQGGVVWAPRSPPRARLLLPPGPGGPRARGSRGSKWDARD